MPPAPWPSPDRFPADRIAVTGASGQLGHQLCRRLGPRAIRLDRDQLNLADADQIRSRLRELRPRVLVNAAAYTAVDKAEADIARCMAINRDAVATLVDVTQSIDCALVQISTDYVFGGATWPGRPYREDDPVAPQGVYARSKAEAEQIVQQHPRHLIIRTCGIYGPTPPSGSGNFVNTMLRLGRTRQSLPVVSDQVCCPTYVAELADAVVHLMDTQMSGVVHVVNRDGVSWYAFAREIFRLANIACQLQAITTAQYGAAAARPPNSELDGSRYAHAQGPPMSTCLQALAKYLASKDEEEEPAQH